MQKLKKIKYRTLKGEIKTNCYKITLSKEIVNKDGFTEDTILEIRADDDKIIIEKKKEK